MIGRLRGLLVEKQIPDILIECSGVGYEVTLPMTSIYALPELGHETTIYTHFVVREDAQLLYGFATTSERRLFRILIKVNGVGPKLALAILSSMSADQFVSCVRLDDVSSIVKIPGVGKKTAERLLVEMRDRLKDWGQTSSERDVDSSLAAMMPVNFEQPSSSKGDAINALVSLGYTNSQAEKAVKQVYGEDKTSEDLIREALKSMV